MRTFHRLSSVRKHAQGNKEKQIEQDSGLTNFEEK